MKENNGFAQGLLITSCIILGLIVAFLMLCLFMPFISVNIIKDYEITEGTVIDAYSVRDTSYIGDVGHRRRYRINDIIEYEYFVNGERFEEKLEGKFLFGYKERR